jgi:glycosidase
MSSRFLLGPVFPIVFASMAPSTAPSAEPVRPVIYQLFVRTFGNTNETRQPDGSIAENGCGKFADINAVALGSLSRMGFTHLWLTGVIEQASGTAYPGRPADDPDLLKGVAGSPYAIRDYFDVSPDYAVKPENRLAEFKELLDRCRKAGLGVLIDFVPNHVARSYDSDVRPDLSFGKSDRTDQFFSRENHFYYLGKSDPGGGPPLKLPSASRPGCDGVFAVETTFGRVTGNNRITWAPDAGDWYETVKLNYGHDFTSGRNTGHLPGPMAGLDAVPSTWRIMDAVLAYWQAMGVDGFRVDMAHMVPMEFWAWAVGRARSRQPGSYFVAEAYDGDPAKLTDGPVLDALLAAGFDAVYDDPSYDLLEGLYKQGKWCNDLDAVAAVTGRFHRSLRSAENHDEVRLANRKEWGGLGMRVGRPVAAVLFAMGRGPIMMYNGQEVGEPAEGAEGFGGDDARTSIFDYWSMPELAKWVAGGKFDGAGLSDERRALRDWYGELIRLMARPAFRAGEFRPLNSANIHNPRFGRLSGETASGHWLSVFARKDPATGEAFLVAANFHGDQSLRDVRVRVPSDIREWLGVSARGKATLTAVLGGPWTGEMRGGTLEEEGFALPDLAPCSAWVIAVAPE